MAKLELKKIQSMAGMDTLRISGFGDGELSELKSMEHYESKEKLIDLLDHRNNGIGTEMSCGNGIYGVWYDNEFAYMNVGSSCD